MTDSTRSPLLPRDYDNAILSQSACNLSGLVHSLSEVLPRIWEESNGTNEVNNHPIVRMYLEQFNHLCRAEYSASYSHCQDNSD